MYLSIEKNGLYFELNKKEIVKMNNAISDLRSGDETKENEAIKILDYDFLLTKKEIKMLKDITKEELSLLEGEK